MDGRRPKIIVAIRCDTTRIKLSTWLSQEGYSTFPCTDSYKALRLARQLLPALILYDVSLNDVSPRQFISIIETDRLSHVLLLTDAEGHDLRQLLALTALKKYMLKPCEQGLFTATVAGLLEELHTKKKQQLLLEKQTLDPQKTAAIDAAKSLLISKWRLSEDQAYAYLRKQSMNNCCSLHAIALEILQDRSSVLASDLPLKPLVHNPSKKTHSR